ncbi:hypothetical protein Tco_1099062 [Tanacetum coccineum]
MTEQDWSKVKRTQDLVEYVYDKYENVPVTDEMLDDLYNFAMMKEKYLSMVESEKKAKLMVESEKGKAKLIVLDEMVKKDDKEKAKVDAKLDDLQNIVEMLEGDLARAIKAKQAKHDKGKAKQAEHDRDDVDLVDALDLENRIKKLEENFKVVQVSSYEGFSDDEDVVYINDVKYLFTGVEIRMFKERPTISKALKASTSTRSRALIASTSTAQAASTSAPKVYYRIAMIGCVLSLRTPNDPTAPPSTASQKRKSKP